MTVLSQSLFTLMRRNFMTLSFFTTRHRTPMIFKLTNNFKLCLHLMVGMKGFRKGFISLTS
jgi:hypothetical protein